MTKTWGGRFSGRTDERVERFTESISVDRRLYRQDIAASQARLCQRAQVRGLRRAISTCEWKKTGDSRGSGVDALEALPRKFDAQLWVP